MNKLVGFSNPLEVAKKAQILKLNPVLISSRKDKKYMIFDGKKMVHFGQIGYEDFTHHKDVKRQQLFKNRNKKWKDAKKYTPAWLSYYLLW